MNLYLPENVDEVTTSIHRHARAKPKRGEDAAPSPLTIQCNDETCIADLRRYGAVDNVRSVPKTYDQKVADEDAKERAAQMSAGIGATLAKMGYEEAIGAR